MLGNGFSNCPAMDPQNTFPDLYADVYIQVKHYEEQFLGKKANVSHTYDLQRLDNHDEQVVSEAGAFCQMMD